ncbi:MAG: hypothetical protein UW68_C0033G0003 [Candidatus Collierbacteria bacterium GW2011_GWB1_44_6]|uniref:ABC transporter permease protein n=2 Tax=Candidatus Collieribacteriota TaxID=1752725 RepID=A0A0G1JLZ1_9BACT|nr:MAG: hypothetical protein UW68_C0033G0003 [Candidatus Collierbacteria bacterium GW2011_GWB1_44_6]KKT82825.1 MAG: protein of unknown function DUF990, ABC-2 type transport system permease protein [Microgenomates group bacterium GW2011_GWC1_44_9]
MKQSVFEEIRIRWVILRANALFSLRESLAYSLNNWGGLASTVVYMLTYLVFLSAIFGKVKSVAGYNYSEILLFTLVTQFNFYLSWIWSIKNLDRLGEDVKSGKLDLILTKPLPALWYVTFQKVDLFMLVFEMWPATIPLIYLLLKNATFQIGFRGLILGILSFVVGHIAIHCFQFLLALVTFWTGEYRGLNGLGYQIAIFGDSLPLEAYPKALMSMGFTAVPFLIHSGLTTSLLLGKTTDIRWLFLATGVMLAFLFIKNKVWSLALRQYSSASS